MANRKALIAATLACGVLAIIVAQAQPKKESGVLGISLQWITSRFNNSSHVTRMLWTVARTTAEYTPQRSPQTASFRGTANT